MAATIESFTINSSDVTASEAAFTAALEALAPASTDVVVVVTKDSYCMIGKIPQA